MAMMMSVRSIRALKLMMPIVAAISLATQLIAVITNDWLHTVESMPNPTYEKFGMPADMEFYKKYTTSGLWSLCHNDPPDSRIQCFKIDYFSQEEYIPDQNDSTMAIPYAVKNAAIYIMLSTILLILGQTIYFMSQICRSRRIYILVSSIPFILAGLLILTGIVVYISTFKNEVGYKLRPISQFQDALFDYRYGYSFLFLVASLLMCELSGTLSIFLYISQKHFKILIDTERDEVLKHNIINILRSQQQQQQNLQNQQQKAAMRNDSVIFAAGNPTQQPMLRITTEDYQNQNDMSPSMGQALHSGQNSPTFNLNFLTPDFGLIDSAAFYQCGRHGSRGRRSSRSSDYLGSPRDTSEISKSRKNSNASVDIQPNINKSNERPKMAIQSDETIMNSDQQYHQLQELYVDDLVHLSHSRIPPTNITNRRSQNSEQYSSYYYSSNVPSKQQANNFENKSYKDCFAGNRSTFV